jgi:hypothetical protein
MGVTKPKKIENSRLRTAAKGKANSQLDSAALLVRKMDAFDVLAGKRTTALWSRRRLHRPNEALRMPTPLAKIIVTALLDAGCRVRSLYSDCRMERKLLDKRIEKGRLS